MVTTMFPTKHVREFLRAIRNKRYEESPGGVLFVDQKVYWEGFLEMQRNGGQFDEGTHNIVPTEGRNYLLDAAVNGGTAYSSWFVVPFATNTVPDATLTAANFNTKLTEFTNYSEGVRQQWITVAAAAGVVTNAASVATITIGSAAQTAVYG